MVTHTPPLAELLMNPLLLMLACQVWEAALKNNEPVPAFSRRCDLYQRCIPRFRRRWIERMRVKGREPTKSAQEAFMPFVEAVAWELWHRGPRRSVFPGSEITGMIESIPKPRALEGRADLFEDICESGILIKAGPQEVEAPYLFLHRTLLEFLAASHVARKSEDQMVRLDSVREIIDYFGNPNAHVMLSMLVGKLKNPAPLLKEIVAWAEQQLELPRERLPLEAPVLAELLVDCLFECDGSTLDREKREKAWELITRGLDRRQLAKRKEGGEWATLVDWSLIYRAMRAVEIHEGPTHRAKEVLELFEDLHHAQLLKRGVLPAGAVSDVDRRLIAGLKSGCSVVRWASIWATTALVAKGRGEIRTVFGRLVGERLQHDPSPHVRCIAARALAEMEHPDALALLGSALDGECRMTAVGAAIGLSRLMTHESLSRLETKVESMLTEAPSGSRDPLLVAVIGALEAAVDRASKSDDTSTLRELLNDEALANIFMRALRYPLPRVKGTAASALGKMRWKAAWEPLKELVEIPDDGAADTRSMRSCACYGCDQLTGVIGEARLEEADRLFRGRLGDRQEMPRVRRPAASGMVKLLRQGYRSAGLVNDLLQAAQDTDHIVAKNSLLALVQIKQEEVLEFIILLLRQFDVAHKILVCVNVRENPKKTGILLTQWLLTNDMHPNVLASALDAVGEAYRKASAWRRREPPDFISDLELLSSLANRAIDLSTHEMPNVVASSLIALQVFAGMDPFRSQGLLFSLREEMVARARALLDHKDPRVQASACGAISILGTQEDHKKLAELKKQSPSRKVRESADAHQLECESQLHEGDRKLWTTFHPEKGQRFFCDECRAEFATQKKEKSHPR